MTRSLVTVSLVLSFFLIGASNVFSACGDTWQQHSADTFSGSCPNGAGGNYYTIKHWRIFWSDGYERSDAQASGRGTCYGGIFSNSYCYAQFDDPYWSQNSSTYGEWYQRSRSRSINTQDFSCFDSPSTPYYTDTYHRHTCNATGGGGCNEAASPTYGCASGFISVGGTCTRSDAFMTQCFRFGDYDFDSCACTGGCEGGSCSPIVIDVVGDGFSLTNALNGVAFDLDTNGVAEQRGWTSSGSDDAWLALDRNGDDLINSGKELFGNVTPQEPPSAGEEMNGFRALALYDGPGYGGNSDGLISQADAIFARLKLWQDSNHNGRSEANELYSLPTLGLRKIDLAYMQSRRVDQHGNQFRYRSKVKDENDTRLGRWAWDVYLIAQP